MRKRGMLRLPVCHMAPLGEQAETGQGGGTAKFEPLPGSTFIAKRA